MAKILIADDDPQIRQMLEETLEELEAYGVELLVAGNGMEALEAIRQHKPELVFLDSLMPKMNGLEVCNTVKKQYAITGHAHHRAHSGGPGLRSRALEPSRRGRLL